jgi:hypothetical protein
MKSIVVVSLLAATAAIAAEVPVQRIAEDARVIDRVAELAKKDLPDALLKRLVTQDIELLRGRRADGSYEYATHERLEASRVAEDFSVQPKKNETDLQTIEIRGSFVYRLIVSSPSRRMVVTKNRRVWVDRADVEYIASNTTATRIHSVKIEKWLAPGELVPVDLPAVARQATARVYARGDAEAGYGNLVLTLVEAKVVDNVDSPYADAVSSAKAMLRAIENGEIPSIRAMAARLYDSLAPKMTTATPAEATVDIVPAAPDPGIYSELQEIEDLLTGSETERRQAADRLHQLIRRLRPRQ